MALRPDPHRNPWNLPRLNGPDVDTVDRLNDIQHVRKQISVLLDQRDRCNERIDALYRTLVRLRGREVR